MSKCTKSVLKVYYLTKKQAKIGKIDKYNKIIKS